MTILQGRPMSSSGRLLSDNNDEISTVLLWWITPITAHSLFVVKKRHSNEHYKDNVEIVAVEKLRNMKVNLELTRLD